MHLLIVILLLPILVWGIASDAMLYREILEGLFPHKKIIKVYVDDKNKAKVLQETGLFVQLVPHPDEADLLILSEKRRIDTNKPIFAGTYRIMTLYPKRSIGGFYWKKGRPTLIFIQSSLHRFHFRLPKKFEKYVE